MMPALPLPSAWYKDPTDAVGKTSRKPEGQKVRLCTHRPGYDNAVNRGNKATGLGPAGGTVVMSLESHTVDYGSRLRPGSLKLMLGKASRWHGG